MKNPTLKAASFLTATLLTVIAGSVTATPGSVAPYTFLSGGTIKAQEMNDNFTAVFDAINNIALTPGTQGADGIQGPMGLMGPQGPAGADGANADPAVTDALDARITALEAALAAHVANVANPHSVTKEQVGLGNVPNTKMNLMATTNPSPSDDSSMGYSAGSVWINVTSGGVSVLVDASPAAAQWRAITNDNQQLICDPILSEQITLDTTVYVPNQCFGDGLIIQDGIFIGQRRTVTTAGPGLISGGLFLDVITEPGGQDRFFFGATGGTVIWEWGVNGWVVVLDTTI